MENCVTESANVQEPAGNWTWWPWSLVGLESTIPISEICDNYICLTISDQSKIGANGEMVKIHKGEGNYIFSVICCWKVLKCILDSIFDTNRSFRRPLIFGKENRLNPWHNAVFILIKEAESCILFMKLLNYIQKYLHWVEYIVHGRFLNVDTYSKSLNCYFPSEPSRPWSSTLRLSWLPVKTALLLQFSAHFNRKQSLQCWTWDRSWCWCWCKFYCKIEGHWKTVQI